MTVWLPAPGNAVASEPTCNSMREALNNPAGDVLVDATTKGIPSNSAPLRLSEIGSQGWNVLAGDCPLPLAVIRTDILAANSAWMMSFVRHHGLLLAPHGKTTMSPALFARQLADGAWAITVATTQQMQVCQGWLRLLGQISLLDKWICLGG